LGEEYEADTWKEQLTDLQWMLDTTVQSGNIKFAADRMKQWLAFFKMQHTGAVDFFESIKRIKDHEQLGALIRSEIEKQG
jgi:tRNA-dihydrouridine synthase